MIVAVGSTIQDCWGLGDFVGSGTSVLLCSSGTHPTELIIFIPFYSGLLREDVVKSISTTSSPNCSIIKY